VHGNAMEMQDENRHKSMQSGKMEKNDEVNQVMVE